MSRYTLSIQEILQEQGGSEEIWSPEEMYELSKNLLFGEEVEVIDEQYRKHFITAFAYHYFLEEIGLETYGLWRMRLAGRVYEHGVFINHVYDVMARDLFSKYSVTKKKGTVSDDGSTTHTGNNKTERDIENTGSSSGESSVDSEGTQTTTNNLSNTTTYNSQQKNTGTTTTTGTGDITDARTGSDVTADTGTTNQEHTGQDTVHNTGTTLTEYGGSDTIKNTGNTRNDLNEVTIFSDTPMGDLENMIHSPQTSAAGAGVNYATDSGTQYNYMSTATEHDYTDVQTNDTNQETIRNTNETRTDNTQSASIYNSSQLQTDDREQTTTYGSQSTQTRNTTDTQTDDTVSARSGSDTEAQTGTQEVESTGNESGTTSEEHHDVTSDDTVRTFDEQGTKKNDRELTEDVDDYTLTYDMILKMEPLMRKIWDLFDSLFMRLI